MYVYKVTFHYIFHQQSFHFKTPKEKKNKTTFPSETPGIVSGNNHMPQKAGDLPFKVCFSS